ncbi:ABC transporter permease [Larkinella knui]|uniref:ABC transporter permease n=1 Tax=Larkinella knui TaxID=2025310 RepID=A0A3P1CDS7_9BACT|nr:ABC transporter permease [Larkinella knui]RRB11457.1 ABC transporter permease [Larkinella knui]
MKPPRWASTLLDWWGDPNTVEEVQGDLLELYEYWVTTVGERKARWRYGLSVLKLLRPFAQSKSTDYPSPFLLSPAMIRNYVKIAGRNLSRNLAFGTINLLGLVLGLTCALIIFLVVAHETSYDHYQTQGDRIYRVGNYNINDKFTYPGTYSGMANAMRNDVPEAELVVPLLQIGGSTVSIPSTGNRFKTSLVYAGNELFRLLDYRWLAGDARTALSEPNTVVLTRALAETYFGTSDVLGKTLRLDNKPDLMVVGVLEDYPKTTSFPFDLLVSFPSVKTSMPDYDLNRWNGWNDNFQVFILLKKDTKPEQVTQRSAAILTKYRDEKAAKDQAIALTPLAEIHYGHNLGGRSANLKLLNILSLIGVFVLLIGCINFINLTTAQAFKRAKEIGIRKAVGSNRLSLIYQFLTEAGMVTFAATLLSILVAWLGLPTVVDLLGIPLTSADLFSGKTVAFLTALFILTTLLAGIYPAFRLSGMAPIWALKNNKMPQGRQTITLRQGLVVVQFTVSLVLITSTLLINQQLSFFKNADLGFNTAAIITVGLPDNSPAKLQTLRNRLAESSQVKDVSFSFNSASAESNWMQGMQYRKGTKAVDIKTQLKMGDSHYLSTYGIQLLAGAGLQDRDSTSFKVIANEVFLNRMGVAKPADAIGEKVYYGDGQEFATIIGVAKNFNVNSLHQKIDPTLIQVVPTNFYQAGIKLQTDQPNAEALKGVLAHIEKAWMETFPDRIFEYSFLDETLAKAYQAETRTSQLIGTATFLAIIIACLGLFGLAAFTAEQRTKEIGVRKVLGASVSGIVLLLSREFLKPVLVALLIASPVAWYAMNEWLQNFEFKVGISWDVFALAGGLAVLIAFLTVSFQSIRAALMNPVKSLRSD